MNKLVNKLKNKEAALVCLFILLGSLARILFIGSYPAGISQDEAFSAYDGLSLMRYGTDCFGYRNPVYHTSWGSGMSVLYSWLIIPFYKILGVNMWSIRLPHALLGIVTLIVFYLFMKKVTNRHIALIGLFIMAVNPWHIVLVRWGLDSGITPAFLMLALYFFVLGLEQEKYLPVSAVFYGLTLYCYAFMWTLLPFMLLIQIGYGVWFKKLRISRVSVLSVCIVGVFAAPLLLFLLVNYGFIPEIKTAFISIPKVAYFRSGEVAGGGFMGKLYAYFKVLFLQDDENIWNAVPGFGIHYRFALVFVFTGLFYTVWDTVKRLRAREYNPYAFLLLQFAFVSGAALVVDKCDTNKLNIMHIPAIAFSAVIIYKLALLLGKKFLYTLAAVYMISFAAFEYTYFTSYNEAMAEEFQAGIMEAVEFAMEQTEDRIVVTDSVFHSQVMIASQIPAPEFVDTVVYTNYPDIWLETGSFGQFVFEEGLPRLEKGTVYIWKEEEQEYFRAGGFMVQVFGNFIVAY